MSQAQEELVKKVLETFVSKADAMTASLLELRTAISSLAGSQNTVIQKLDDIRLELRELATRIEMAVRK